jgi:hypothetical protein
MVLSHGILWLLLILFTLNFIGIGLIRSDERFWLPSITIWMLLLCTLFINMTINKNNVLEKEITYNTPKDPDSREAESAMIGLQEARNQQHFENYRLLRLIGFQTFLCLLCQLLGYKLTSKTQFRKGSIAFLLFLVLYGSIELITLFF